MRTIADLGIGDHGFITGFTDEKLSLKLLEMGCLPGTEVILTHHAPFGDPIAIRVGEYKMCLRLSDADCIDIKVK